MLCGAGVGWASPGGLGGALPHLWDGRVCDKWRWKERRPLERLLCRARTRGPCSRKAESQPRACLTHRQADRPPPSAPSPRKCWTWGRRGLSQAPRRVGRRAGQGAVVRGLPQGVGGGEPSSHLGCLGGRGDMGPRAPGESQGSPRSPHEAPPAPPSAPEGVHRQTMDPGGRLQGPSPPCHWALPISASRMGRKGGVFRSRHSSDVPSFLRGSLRLRGCVLTFGVGLGA